MRMNEMNNVHQEFSFTFTYMCVCSYIEETTNIKAKPNSKWNPLISSENEPWKKGREKETTTFASVFGVTEREKRYFFYHFWTRSRRRLEWTANKANAGKREAKLIRDVRRIEFRIKLFIFPSATFGIWMFLTKVFKFSKANDTECL